MRILYLGVDGYENIVPGLRRLGHDVYAIDPFEALPQLPLHLTNRWAWKTGALGLAKIVERHVLARIEDRRFDIAFVLRGDLISKSLLEQLPVERKINFNNDDPFGPRDGSRWRLFKRAVDAYDLFVAPREASLTDAKSAGVKNVLRVHLWADELVHKPRDRSEQPEALRSEVAFVGTWMPERGRFMKRLVERGVPVRIYGLHWHKAPEYSAIKHNIIDGLLSPADYTSAIAGCRIALAMLSKGNRDLHTRRSNEIPAMARLLCAERTSEHLAMYRENEEAFFWSNADECADQCHSLLAQPKRLDEVADRGYARCLRNGFFTEPTLDLILERSRYS